MNKKEKVILAVVLVVVVIICAIIAIKLAGNKKQTTTLDPNNIYKVTMDKKYSKSKNKFTIIFSNVREDVIINDSTSTEKIRGNSDGQIIFENIEPGSTHKYIINDLNENKKNERRTTITLPYYNEFYDREECKNYRDKLAVCKNQFLNYVLTEEVFEETIKNYGKTYN